MVEVTSATRPWPRFLVQPGAVISLQAPGSFAASLKRLFKVARGLRAPAYISLHKDACSHSSHLPRPLAKEIHQKLPRPAPRHSLPEKILCHRCESLLLNMQSLAIHPLDKPVAVSQGRKQKVPEPRAVCMAKPKQMPAGRQTFPMKVLLGRLEQGAAAPWSSFLPDHLRPKGVTAKVFEQSVPKDAANLSQESKAPKADYVALGICVVGRVWEYSQDPLGCREVQHAIETADEKTVLRIAAELRDHATCRRLSTFLQCFCVVRRLAEGLRRGMVT